VDFDFIFKMTTFSIVKLTNQLGVVTENVRNFFSLRCWKPKL